ncbi:hypothetical protein JX265_005838 [Neoarthrinium moseri]|uniref:Mmc1 C-terminal domain-containing protein n=1 Tax=Neoarthrinium moseri TaxID=1658444 RepID=A0A9P9WN24_9PEZI|nr:hypothetical protein JX265_005838 [Neoarthrinium moseri]
MPARLPPRATAAGRSLLEQAVRPNGKSVCLFCSLTPSPSSNSTRNARRKAVGPPRRLQSTSTSAPPDARKELEDALVDLQRHAANFVNLSRLQLAVNGLRQQPGNEAIRVAILGLTDGAESGKSAKQVLKLLLADPLKDEEEWERQVERHDLAQPMIIRVGREKHQEPGTISLANDSVLHEVNVSSATLNGHNLELLLMETFPFDASPGGGLEGFEDSVLVPAVEIPASDSGRFSPITTPVHKALVVGNGLMGAASVVSLPLLESESFIKAAVDMPGYKSTDTESLPFVPVDVGTARVGLGLIRNSLNDAMEYERMWFQSNMPKLAEWLKTDISSAEGVTKAPVRRLIASVLQNASASIQHAEARQVSTSLGSTVAPTSTQHLKASLAEWAENAHGELQESLDLAFSSKRWRKLGWWKLFWRVDDVHMLTTDILNQRFLPNAEKNAIYLAGRIQEASSRADLTAAYRQPEAPETDEASNGRSRWPINIPTTRAYLQNETIPALQALAQKLVFQTLSTSGLTTSLGALAYFGTLTTGIYEAGAVAALGIVWSLNRMQKQWEIARKFWEGEVREEGRKAVRGVEVAVEDVLEQTEDIAKGDVTSNAELDRARQLVAKATDALERLK